MVSSNLTQNCLISNAKIAFFDDYLNKTFDILKNMLFISKNAEHLIFATPSEGSGFLKSGMFRMIASYRPMISP